MVAAAIKLTPSFLFCPIVSRHFFPPLTRRVGTHSYLKFPHNRASLTRCLFMPFSFLRSLPHQSPSHLVRFLFFFFSFLFCKTRSSTHILTTPCRFPPPLVVFVLGSFLKSRLYPQSDLYYYTTFSLSLPPSSSSCSIVAWVGVSLSSPNLLPCIFILNDKRKKAAHCRHSITRRRSSYHPAFHVCLGWDDKRMPCAGSQKREKASNSHDCRED
jgi:hypothetical protein